MNSMPFRQLKSFLKILIGVQYERAKITLSASGTSPRGRGKALIRHGVRRKPRCRWAPGFGHILFRFTTWAMVTLSR